MSKYQKKHKSKGFTLIEVLAAITLLGIVLVAFIPFFSNYINFTSISENRLTAINLADELASDLKTNQDKIDLSLIKSCPEQSIVSSTSSTDIEDVYQINNKSYYPVVSICQSADPEISNRLYQVKVTIEIDRSDNGLKELTHVFSYLLQEAEGGE